MRKIPDDAQVCNVMVGELPSLKYQVSAFVRLSEARILGELTEVPLPTRFLFFLLGPAGSEAKCIEIGRSLSTVMVDEVGTVKTCVKRQLKNRQNKDLNDRWKLNAGRKYCRMLQECSPWSILQNF